jgi:hypothetical protein
MQSYYPFPVLNNLTFLSRLPVIMYLESGEKFASIILIYKILHYQFEFESFKKFFR